MSRAESSTRRWCRKCERPTEHDSFSTGGSALSRTLWAVGSCGISELMHTRYWKCQRCGTETNQVGGRVL